MAAAGAAGIHYLHIYSKLSCAGASLPPDDAGRDVEVGSSCGFEVRHGLTQGNLAGLLCGLDVSLVQQNVQQQGHTTTGMHNDREALQPAGVVLVRADSSHPGGQTGVARRVTN